MSKENVETKQKAALVSSEVNSLWNFLLHKELGGEQGKPVTPAQAGETCPRQKIELLHQFLKDKGQKCRFCVVMARYYQSCQNLGKVKETAKLAAK